MLSILIILSNFVRTKLITIFITNKIFFIPINQNVMIGNLKLSKKSKTIVTLGILMAIGPFSIDTYLPGFPAIAESLGTDISNVGLSLTSYFIGISLGQLGYGPITDRFGRKKPLIIGLIIYLLSSIGCVFAPTIYWLIGLRFLMALGACAGMVASRAIVRDLFPIQEIAKVFSLLTLIMGVAPIIAPTIGGIIVALLGWRYIFVLLTLIAAFIIFAVYKYLPESKGADTSVSLHPINISKEYILLFKNKTFLLFGVACGCASASMFSYISASPFVYMNLFGISESMFGWIYGLNAFALISASQFNRYWLEKKSSKQITLITLLLQLLSAVFIIISITAGLTYFIIMVLIFIYLFWLGFLNPNTTALALEPFSKNAGSASALLGSFQMVFGAAASVLVSVFYNGTAMPMAVLMAVFSLWGMLSVLAHKFTIGKLEKKIRLISLI